jgi:hypothetical protein
MTEENETAATSGIYYQICQERQDEWNGNELPSPYQSGPNVEEDKDEVKSNAGEETRDRVLYVKENPSIERGVDEKENDGKQHEDEEVACNDQREGLESVAPDKFSPPSARLHQKSKVANDETGNEDVKNLNPVADKFTRHLRNTLAISFTAGIIISSLLSTLSFDLAFIALASALGLSGGLILSEVLFLEIMEEKA